MSQNLVAVDSQHHLPIISTEQELVTMKVGGQLFGISVMTVQDVLRRQRITRVPLAPRIVAGSLNLRGRIVTAIDMRLRLGMPGFEDTASVMHVVVENKGELYSLMVDAVGDVLSLPLSGFEKTPANLNESWQSVAAGVFKLKKELLVILDVGYIIWKT